MRGDRDGGTGPAMAQTMRAIQIDTYGDESVVKCRTVPIPGIAADEVLVRLHYTGINFMDIHTRQGKYRTSRTYAVSVPTTLGSISTLTRPSVTFSTSAAQGSISCWTR